LITTISIICGLTLVVLGRKHNFIFMWLVLLNALIAIYVSVMLSPTLVGRISVLGDRNFLAASMIVIAVGVLSGTLMLAIRVLSPALDYRLPAFWDQCGSGCCAFVTGYLTVNYVLFVVSITPLANALELPDVADDSNPIVRACAPPIAAACQVVGTLSLQSDRDGSRHVVDWLISDRELIERVEGRNDNHDHAD
jgi:hypothetical protein